MSTERLSFPLDSLDTVVSGRSPIQVYFRMAVLLLVVMILWLGILLNTYWSTQNEIVTMLADEEKTQELLKAQNAVILIVGWLGTLIVAALLIFGAWIAVRAKRNKMRFDHQSITTPKGVSLRYDELDAIVFYTIAVERDRMLHEGVLVPADDSPNTTLDSIFLLPVGTDPKELTKDPDMMPKQVVGISRFYMHANNEKIAGEIAARFLAANKNGTVWTVINRFQKQRVIWRMPTSG